MKHTELEGMENTTAEGFLNLDEVDIHTPDDLFIKTFVIPAGVLVPQHKHQYKHATLVCYGKVAAWKNKAHIGEYKEGQIIEIEADCFHEFLALEESRLACIHNVELYDALVELNGFEVE